MDAPLDTTTEIETPEHVRFRHVVAGPVRRAFAYLIDLLIRGGVIIALLLLAGLGGLLSGDSWAAASQGLLLLVMFVIEWGTFVLFETLMNGRTPGKAILGLRVVTSTGHPLQLTHSVLRNLLRAADFLPVGYALGLVVMARDGRFRRLGDLVAGTMVVVEQRQLVEGPVRIEPPPTPSELKGIPELVPLAARELDAIELLLRRSRTLPSARERELAELVAPVFASRLGVARVDDPHRFLALLYHRARGSAAS